MLTFFVIEGAADVGAELGGHGGKLGASILAAQLGEGGLGLGGVAGLVVGIGQKVEAHGAVARCRKAIGEEGEVLLGILVVL